MSALVRYQRLQRKALGYEAAGLVDDPEYQRIKDALAETAPHLSDAEKAAVGLGEAKVAESVGVDVNAPKVVDGKKSKAKKDQEAAPETVSGQEQSDAAPTAGN